ncbi:MAG: hypothetical protein ABIF87_01970 [Pseudomonadota bacterium]
MQKLGIEEAELSADNAQALAMLAWCELVEAVETKGLPILVAESRVLYGKDEIETYLQGELK